jgi:hypothetical protein
MVIGDDEMGAGSSGHLFLARGLRQTTDRVVAVLNLQQLSPDGRTHASAQ